MAADLEIKILGDSSLGPHETGWLRASVHVDGKPYWPSDASATPAGFDWTWIDLLAYLAEHWSALMLEESWPIPLGQVANPADLTRKAKERWQEFPIERIDEEESLLLSFMERHNLAYAFNGAYVPMLFWLRTGKTLWLVTEDDIARRVDFATARGQLERIGEQLAQAFADSQHPQVRSVIAAWSSRTDRLGDHFLAYRSGLNPERIAQLGARIDLGIPAANDILLGTEPPALAAARMSRFVLTTDQIGVIMERLQRVPATQSEIFAERSPAALSLIERCATQPPWQQGYAVAIWLREQLGLSLRDSPDPEALLRDEGVIIDTLMLDTPHLDAIACWGTVQASILLNGHPQARPAHRHGRRTTLAHELCHLLVDRERALPVAEVLGGDVDLESEKRANAFAAEWLLPRAWAAQALRQAESVEQAIGALSQRHEVSPHLVAWQILNAQTHLTEDERIRLQHYID